MIADVPILLPPSEGKTTPLEGPALDLSALAFAAELTAARQTVMAELAQVSATDQAAQVLGLGPRSAADAALNTVLPTAPCAPAYRLYTGVLFEAAGLAQHFASALTAQVANREVLVLSGLWGVLRSGDLVPDHRAAMGVRLPRLGRLAGFWRPQLAGLLDRHCADQVVVDCRSADYAAAWQPSQGVCELLRVRVVTEQDGRRKVVSHHAKHSRGLLAGALLTALERGEGALDTPQAVAQVAAGLEAVSGVELGRPDRQGRQDLTLVLA